MNNTLPDKLSDLLELALSDLKKIQEDPKYVVNMDYWYNLNSSTGKCEVCLAGAVMVKTLDVKGVKFRAPNFFEAETQNKLYALNHCRNGDISGAYLLITDRINQEVKELDEKLEDPDDIEEVIPYLENVIQELRKLNV